MNKTKIKYSITVLVILFSIGTKAFAFSPTDTIYYTKKKADNLKSKIFDPPIVLKTSPTALLWGGIFPFTSEYRFLAEVTTGRAQSDQAGISYLGKNILYKALEKAANISTDEVFKVSGWKLQYAHRFYLIPKRKHAPNGFYIGPMVAYSYAHVSIGLQRHYSQTYYDFHNLNANLIIGLQVAHQHSITFDIYAGAGYKSNTLYYHATTLRYAQLSTTDFWPTYTTHVNAVFGVNLGYAF